MLGLLRQLGELLESLPADEVVASVSLEGNVTHCPEGRVRLGIEDWLVETVRHDSPGVRFYWRGCAIPEEGGRMRLMLVGRDCS